MIVLDWFSSVTVAAGLIYWWGPYAGHGVLFLPEPCAGERPVPSSHHGHQQRHHTVVFTSTPPPISSLELLCSELVLMSHWISSSFVSQYPRHELSEPPWHPDRPAGSPAHHRHLPLHRERDEADPQDPVRTCSDRPRANFVSLPPTAEVTRVRLVSFQVRGGGRGAERRGSHCPDSHWHGDIAALRHSADQHCRTCVPQTQGQLSHL